ncbi:hypothetical protein [Methanobacterium sp.]|uniref:hypothetical protein n=1 Tax=Methanobacterium sp. TaxID=2164 RepID=UPI003C72F350
MAGFVNIDSNILSLAGKIKAKPAKIKKGIQNGLDESAKYGVNQEKAFLGPHSKSGRTLRSIKWVKNGEYSRSFGPFTDSIAPGVLEKGRGPVYPKLAGRSPTYLGKSISGRKTINYTGLKHSVGYLGVHIGAVSLKFTVNGKTIFRKSVGHADPRPFIAPTRKSMQTMFPKIMAKNIGNALKS